MVAQEKAMRINLMETRLDKRVNARGVAYRTESIDHLSRECRNMA